MNKRKLDALIDSPRDNISRWAIHIVKVLKKEDVSKLIDILQDLMTK